MSPFRYLSKRAHSLLKMFLPYLVSGLCNISTCNRSNWIFIIAQPPACYVIWVTGGCGAGFAKLGTHARWCFHAASHPFHLFCSRASFFFSEGASLIFFRRRQKWIQYYFVQEPDKSNIYFLILLGYWKWLFCCSHKRVMAIVLVASVK